MEQRYDTTWFILSVRTNLEAMNQLGEEILKNVPEQQRVLEFIDDLSVKIEYSQTLVQRFLNKAVADIGIDSKSTQLLIQPVARRLG